VLARFGRDVASQPGPQRLWPAYDSGDHVHPDDAGDQAMANAVSLALLLGS
jgi:lysophospholipase L1-like esterase